MMARRDAWETSAARLDGLLDAERDLIRRGDIAGLGAHAQKTEAALRKLLAAPPPDHPNEAADRLASMRARAERNGRLLLAMIEGAREAKAMIEAQSEATRRLGYEPGGTLVSRRSGGRDRRA